MVPFLILVAVAETSVLPALQVGNAQPDLMLLVIGAWSLRRGVEEGAVWAFVGGIALGLLTAGPFTAMLLGLLAASLILGIDPSTGIGRHQTRPFGGNPVALIAGVALATLAFHAIILVSLQLAGRRLDWLDAGVRVIAPRLLFNLVLVPFIYHPLGWLDRRTRREAHVL